MNENLDEAKISLCRILHKLIFDNYKNDNIIKDKFKKIGKKFNKIEDTT